MTARPKVLITDVVWGDVSIETDLLAQAGFDAVLTPDPSAVGLARSAAELRAEGILTCFAPVTAEVIDASPSLRAISRLGVGVDNIDVDHANRRGIAVDGVAEYCSNEVAVHAVALALACWRRLPQYQSAVLAGRWGTGAQDTPVRRAAGARAVVLGRGRIGRRVEQSLEALGFVMQQDIDGADLVSIHLPLTPETERLADQHFFDRLAPGAIVINTARGGVLDVDAAIAALGTGQLSALGLDVFPSEPLPADSALRTHPNVVLTPHVAFYSEESLIELRTKASENLVGMLR